MTAYEERLGLDELRRAHALDKAIETVGPYATDAEVLDRARKFEDYLKKEVRADEPEPEPGPEVEVLVKPERHDNDIIGVGGRDKCRLCLWNDLKKKLGDA